MEQNPSEKTPKVFISYAWSSEEHQERVIDLATRLMSDAIEVILDIWELEEGADVYAFMEKCIVDKTVDKVLIICDENYAQKADERKGGVGSETCLISTEVYGKVEQTKFIPIIFERNEESNDVCVPAYLKSRKYFDMSDLTNFEVEYEKLIRNLFNKPLLKKPPLGVRPALLDDMNTNLHELRSIIKKFEKSKSPSASNVLAKQFLRSYIGIVKTIHPEDFIITIENAIEAVNKLKPVRDLYIDFLEACAQERILTADLVVEFLSETYNEVCKVTGNEITGNPFADIRFLLWEMVLCSVAILYSLDFFEQIYLLACSPVYVRRMYFASDNIQDNNITFFGCGAELIGQAYKNQNENEKSSFHPLVVFLSTREKQPAIAKEMLAFSDVLFRHVTQVAEIQGKTQEVWFAFTQVKNIEYHSPGIHWVPTQSADTKSQNEWVKLSSSKFCSSILPLFGVNSIAKLKETLQAIENPEQLNYASYFKESILDIIPLEKIATRD